MQTLIVCGSPWSPLAQVEAILHSAGSCAARPTQAGSVNTLTAWHERLFSGQPQANSPVQPGKPWELAAGELFLANWEQAVWSWADSRSTWLMDFWRDFDPNTRFVLVHTPVQTVLAHAIANTTSPAFDANAIVQQWCLYQAELLRFYHRNRARCVLVQSESALNNPQAFIASVNAAWGTRLNAAACAPAPAQPAPGLTDFLVQHLLQSQPEAQALQQEFIATLTQDPSQPVPAPLGASALVEELRTLYHARDDKSAIQALQQENELLLQQLQQSKQALAHEQQAQAASKTIANQQAEKTQLAAARQEMEQESELLLLQLHQVQEELEHYFLQHQQATQEKQQLQVRLDKMAKRYPDYCEWDRIEPVPGQNQRWQIHGLKTMGRNPGLLDVSIEGTDNPTLVLTPPADANATPLLHWPTAHPSQPPSALHVQPSAGSDTEVAQTLRQLTPSDLQLLQTACNEVAQWLPTSQPEHEPTLAALATLRQQLQQLPATWRFDTVQLQHTQVNPDYEHLWFTLGNATYGDRHWPHFEFRLSAANVKKGKFSTQPKLEFPLAAQGAHQFENWFEESEDERGPKFELRFDTKARGFDINTWNALNATDQAQALSIVAHLPHLLNRLQQQGSTIKRPWADWLQLATDMQHTLATCLGMPDAVFDVL